MPLLGGYMADVHWGRFKTIVLACCAAIAGHTLLVLSSIPSIIVEPASSLALLVIGILVVVCLFPLTESSRLLTSSYDQGLGTGGVKACVGYAPPAFRVRDQAADLGPKDNDGGAIGPKIQDQGAQERRTGDRRPRLDSHSIVHVLLFVSERRSHCW